MTKNLTNRLYQKKFFYKTTLAEGESVSDYISKFKRIISDLLDVDVKIEDEDQALILLFSLPESYENLVQIFLYGSGSITMDEATSVLFTNEVRKLAYGGSQTGMKG